MSVGNFQKEAELKVILMTLSGVSILPLRLLLVFTTLGGLYALSAKLALGSVQTVGLELLQQALGPRWGRTSRKELGPSF
jgi:hypothetical protein